MIKLNKILVIGLLLFSACKPQELSLIGNLGRRVRVGTADGFVYAELGSTSDKIFTADEKSYAWYDKGLINITQGDYSGRLLHGQYVAYYAVSKQLKEKGGYTYGLKRGKWLVWQSNGQLLESQHWYSGLKNGKTIVYDSLGKEKQKVKYRNGVLVEKKERKSVVARFKKLFKGKKKTEGAPVPLQESPSKSKKQ